MFADSLLWFDQISLPELNESMSLMDRKEQKYIVHFGQLKQIIIALKNEYRLLTIGSTDMFSYENVYMDTAQYEFFQGARERKQKESKN